MGKGVARVLLACALSVLCASPVDAAWSAKQIDGNVYQYGKRVGPRATRARSRASSRKSPTLYGIPKWTIGETSTSPLESTTTARRCGSWRGLKLYGGLSITETSPSQRAMDAQGRHKERDDHQGKQVHQQHRLSRRRDHHEPTVFDGSTITGSSAGSYRIRYAETDDAEPDEQIIVTIPESDV